MVKIENTEVTKEHIDEIVLYIPDHANGNRSHDDTELGFISSFDDDRIWVRFRGPMGQLTPTKNLRWL